MQAFQFLIKLTNRYVVILLALLFGMNGNAQITINEVSSKNNQAILDEFGQSSDWIELYNSGNSSVSLNGLFITDNPENKYKWQFGNLNITGNGYLLIFASGRSTSSSNTHIDFKLSGQGEYVGLFNTDGSLIDETRIPQLYDDVSYCRIPNGVGTWVYAEIPTPNQFNQPADVIQQSNPPAIIFSEFFNSEKTTIEMQGDGNVHYTIDGKLPDESDFLYQGPFEISNTTTIRCRAFEQGKIPSTIVTKTVFVNVEHDLPIVSLVSDPINLWDENEGILVDGPNADSVFPFFGANFWLDKSSPIDVSFFDDAENLLFQQESKAEVHGGRGARTLPQKPLRLTATKTYGPELFNYQLYDYRPIQAYKNIVLRNGSGDWDYGHIRDAYLCKHIETEGLNIDVPGYRPAAVYLNGDYYGLMNIRDKLDEYFLNEKYGTDPEQVDFLERDSIVLNGDFDVFLEMLDFATQNDLSIQENLDSVAKLFELEEVTDYFILETALNNYDWPQNNIKYWREKKAGAIWRYVLFDLDGCCGRHPWSEAKRDNFGSRFAEYPDKFIIRLMTSLFENEKFKINFLNRYADILNTSLREEYMEEVTIEATEKVSSEMKKHYTVWAGSFNTWEEYRIPRLIEFFQKRPDFAREYLINFFDLNPNTVNLQFSVFPENAGAVSVNTLSPEVPWDGIYFSDIPIDVSVVPNSGYEFSHWQFEQSELQPNGLSFSSIFSEDDNLVAVFKSGTNEEGVQIYPNPSKEAIQVILPKGFIAESMSIVDPLGREIRTYETFQAKIDVSGMEPGVYFLWLQNSQGEVVSSTLLIDN